MTKKELEQTKWAHDFKKYCQQEYDLAIAYATNKKLEVCIVDKHQIKTKHNDRRVALQVIIEGRFIDFWLCTKRNRYLAEELCNEMGWKISSMCQY